MARKCLKRTRDPAVAISASADGVPAGASTAGRVQVGRFVWFAVWAWCVAVFVVLIVVLGVLRAWSGPGSWPQRDDVGLSIKLAAAGSCLLVVSSCVLCGARRVMERGAWRRGACYASVALLLAVSALGLRAQEYRLLCRDGIGLTGVRDQFFDQADLYYLHAVKKRLQQLSRGLEVRRTARPAAFSVADQQRLDLITMLQEALVGWTEQEVGHWLEDTQQRRELIELMAYQIHPTAGRRDGARARAEVEKEALQRRRQWFAVLREYCQQPAGADASARQPGVRETLERLGAGDWAFAAAVFHDAGDSTLLGERLNQINASLVDLDAREAFVRTYLDPHWQSASAPGLNRAQPGLRLPVSFPNARAWAACFAAITLWHSVMLVLSALTLVWWLCQRGRRARQASGRVLTLCWHTTSVLGVVVLGVLYGW